MNVFITGVSRGLGLAIAKAMAKPGVQILGTARNMPADEDVDAIRRSGANFRFFSQDLADGAEAADNIRRWAEGEVQSIDLLVLNAGFYIEGDLLEIADKDMMANLCTNFIVNHFLSQRLVPLVRLSERRRIVIIGSTAAYEPYPLVPSYGVAKWALRGYAINLRKELIEDRVGVTFLSPGATWTSMWEGEDLPRNRLLEPSDISKMVETIVELSETAVPEEIIVRSMEGDFHE